MTTATIQITPRAFGNIAAAAMSHGCDVTSFLVRHAITAKPAAKPRRQAAAAPQQHQPELPLEPAAPAEQAAAPSTGVLFG